MVVKLSRAQLSRLGIVLEGERGAGVHLEHGPWTCAFVAATDHPVRSKSNFRRGSRLGQRWGQVVEFEDHIRQLLGRCIPEDWPYAGLEVGFKDRPKVVGFAYARAILDVANLPKSLYDAAEGVVYANDASVAAEASYISRARVNPLLVVGFAALEPSAGVEEVHAAMNELGPQVLGLAALLQC